MKKIILISLMVTAMVLITGCGSKKEVVEKNETIKEEVVKTHLGGSILLNPTGEVPEDLYQVGKIELSDEFKPFTKKLTVYGITLIGRDDISDEFMTKVGKTIVAMFPTNESIDTELQKKVIENMYKYRTTIPLFKGEFEGEDQVFTPEEKKLWEVTTKNNSVCDIIMEDIPGQVMEVVEHILHHVSDVGLHYTFPEEWGISETSKINLAMKKAIEKKYYDVSQYTDIPAGEIRFRVLIQEYAYWIIYGVWDFRTPFGPKNAEFSIMTSAEIKENLPASYDLVMQTIPKIMAAPDMEMMKDFFEKPEKK